jgi:peptidoglycan/LPS O-acetylase OafA/YrhL
MVDKMKYRAEIDGLRTVAVLPVIFFHAGFEQIGGGFIGVDVFFVISGYLITQIISQDLDLGKFSIADFYVRRAKRILPALFLILIFTSVAAALISDKDFLSKYAWALMSVTTFSANIYFWKTASYFDTSSEYNPLLHMWSLAVEEQYYLFFPIILAALWKMPPIYRLLILVAMFVLSIAAAEWGSVNAPTATFYLLPTRFWELLAGGFAALYGSRWSQARDGGVQAQLLSMLGLALITWSILTLDELTPFPGRYAVAPVLGAVLIILFAMPNTLTGAVLSSAPFVFIGKISYSAYLWHQPLFALYRQVVPVMSVAVALLLIALTLVLAYLSWKFVETPFRQIKDSQWRVLSVSAVGIVVLTAIGPLLYGYSNYRQWGPQEAKLIALSNYKIPRQGSCFLDSSLQSSEKFAADCRGSGGRGVLVWGDSHAAALASGFVELGEPITQFTANSCPPLMVDAFKAQRYCYAINRFVLSEVARAKPHIVVLDGYWGRYATRLEAIKTTVAMIKAASPATKVVVMGGVPLWPVSLPKYLIMTKTFAPDTRQGELVYVNNPKIGGIRKSDVKIRALVSPDATFMPVEKILCKQDSCAAYIKNGDEISITAYDYGHLTKFGASVVASMILNDPNLKD